MLKKIFSGIQAGILISIGGSVFLAVENRIAGSILFSVALLCICLKGYALFTGKVGFIPESHTKDDVSVLLLCLFGNAAATVGCGYALMYAIPNFKDVAYVLCSAKLEQAPIQTLVRAIFCGILMYLAVSIYREGKGIVGILFCIPVFILSGFEHSIADIFYFATSGIVSLKSFIFLMIVVAGNAIGGMLLPLLGMIGKGKKKNAD